MNEACAENIAEDAKSNQHKDHAAGDESQSMTPVDQHQPTRKRNWQQDEVVLDEKRDGEEQRSKYHVARDSRRAQGHHQPPDRDRVTEQLRIVHAHIVASQKQAGDEK